MDNEKLIEFVREHTFLYDLSDRRYSDNHKKDVAWKEISNKLNVHENECKKAWFLLRDCFRRALKKQKETKSGQASVPCKKLKYEEQMSFLVPYFKERPTICTVTTEVEDGDYCSVSLDGACSIPPVGHPPDDEASPDNNPSSLKTPTKSTPVIRPTKRQRSNPSLVGRKHTSEETPSTALMKYILDNKKNPDDIQQFFAGIATTVKSFPLRERAIAKAKVFAVISKMEIDILSNPSTSSANQSPDGSRGRSPFSPTSETQMPESLNVFFQFTSQTEMPQPVINFSERTSDTQAALSPNAFYQLTPHTTEQSEKQYKHIC